MNGANVFSAGASHSSRKQHRLTRELAALRLMSRNLWLIELSLAFLMIPTIGVLSLSIMYRGGFPVASIGVIVSIVFGISIILWWVGRRRRMPTRTLMWIGWLSFCIATRSLADPPIGLGKGVKKEPRRAKLKRAIARRIAMLNAMGVARP
jgi:hypothetical protein